MDANPVLTLRDIHVESVRDLLARYHLSLELMPDGEDITASFWGEQEAGIVGSHVYARNDTPVHSVLHEACHIICMDEDRRACLDRDAGGDDLEEAAVCYLQIVLADQLKEVGAKRLMSDMDVWGYTFRVGSTRRWYDDDADDARDWLVDNGLLGTSGAPEYRSRK
ncbi:MAG: hypothetical protein OER97_02495 [Gammaproteobacteria bacterium]|nr:hypothetical protein [Gammaproteobacteria bacterium]